MTTNPQVLALWKKRARRGPMDPMDCLELVADDGIVDDANRGGRRQVTLIEAEAWSRAEAAVGTSVDPSARRANVLVAGVELDDSRGRILRLGDCKIHILGETRPCPRMDEAQRGLQDALRPETRGGVYGQVVEGGRLAVGDAVEWAGSAPLPSRKV